MTMGAIIDMNNRNNDMEERLKTILLALTSQGDRDLSEVILKLISH